MNREVQNVAPAPVFISGVFPHLRIESWSGREDSNLRSLSPEDISPSRTPQFSVVFTLGLGAYSAVSWYTLNLEGSLKHLGALS